MKSVMLWALIVLNIMLLSVVVDRQLVSSTARAAGGGRLGNVLAVPGNLPGANNGVVFLLDSTNRMLSAISFDEPTGKVAAMPQLDVQRVLDNAGGVGAGRRPR